MEPTDLYQHGEGRTGIGQAVEFTCPSDAAEEVRAFLREKIRTINTPTTHRVNVAHGGYGRYTRYDVVQHDYAGGGSGGCCGFIEVLEIKNPPDGRWGIVFHEHTNYKGSNFTEWETIENALAAFANRVVAEDFSSLPGFKRRVVCGLLTPWFYAIGDEELIGDYTFPDGLQDDAVFRFGQKFVVFDNDGVPSVKTCMGTRLIGQKQPDGYLEKGVYRLVYWDDGSVWNESNNRGDLPRPAEDGEMWIAEAVQQFRKFLSGQSTEFAIDFTDGFKFVGRLVRPKCRVSCPEGDYLIAVHFKGGRIQEGWVNDFKPTDENPDIVQLVTQRLTRNGEEVERVEIKKRRIKRGGKKWQGVFFHISH